MPIDVLFFGQLVEFVGRDSVSLEGITSTGNLIKYLHREYPLLASSKYMLAVDKVVVKENIELADGNTIALLPPFSGG